MKGGAIRGRIKKRLGEESIAIRKDYVAGLITILVIYLAVMVGEMLLKLPTALKININWVVAGIFIAIPPLLVGIIIRNLKRFPRIKKYLKKLPTEVVNENLYRFWDGNKFLLGAISEPYLVKIYKKCRVGKRTVIKERMIRVVLFSEITGGPTSPGGGIAGKEIPLKDLIKTDYTKKDAIAISMTLGGKERSR